MGMCLIPLSVNSMNNTPITKMPIHKIVCVGALCAVEKYATWIKVHHVIAIIATCRTCITYCFASKKHWWLRYIIIHMWWWPGHSHHHHIYKMFQWLWGDHFDPSHGVGCGIGDIADDHCRENGYPTHGFWHKISQCQNVLNLSQNGYGNI